jgi:DNA-directed RNA polymerase subunit F
MRRLARGPLLALATAAILACTRKTAHTEQRDGGSAASGVSAAQAAQVLARVGERTITVGDYVTALEHMDQFDRMRYQAPERRQELLNEMIDVMLLANEARERGYDKDPITQQEIRQILRDAMLRTTRDGTATPSAIPDVEVRTYYDAHKADFHDPERRRVSAIILATEAATREVLEAAKRATATQWGDLVRTKSVDPRSKPAAPADLAGDLGFVSSPGDPRGANPRVPDELRSAIFEVASVGELVPRPVKAGGQYYVARLTSKTDPHDRTYEEAERAIRVRLAQDKIHAKEEALVDELRKQYPVQIDEASLTEVRVDLSRSDGGNAKD